MLHSSTGCTILVALNDGKILGAEVFCYLESNHPNLTVYHFCKELKDENIRRLDVVNKLVHHLICMKDRNDAKA